MEAIFKKVMCSDGLPEKNGSYNTSLGTQYFSDVSGWGLPYRGKWEYPKDNTDPEFWFEQKELPSEGEKTIESLHYSTGKSSSDVFRQAHEVDFIAGFNKAIELIKGGK